MFRFELLNALVKAHGYTSYLEIGVEAGYTFDRIGVQHKVGVDPNGLATLQLTSDEFFAANLEAFDLIFVDGCHEEHQAYRDMVCVGCVVPYEWTTWSGRSEACCLNRLRENKPN